MRRTALILILLSLPALAMAQQPGATHTVRAGETLGDIARTYLGSSAAWTRIFEANRNQISDPDRIVPGMVLVIPGGQAGGAATVLGFSQDGRFLQSVTDRRDLVEERAFTPNPAPEPQRERTIFFDSRNPEDFLPAVYFTPVEEVSAVPQPIFESAAWIDDGQPPLGEVIGLAGDQPVTGPRTTIHPYDDVRVVFDLPGTPAVGERFLVYRVRQELEGVGRILSPTGVVEVLRSDAAGVIARVVREFDRMQPGQFVRRIPSFPLEPGVHPEDSRETLSASLLAFRDRKELHLPGDLAFIDRGAGSGITVGDEFSAWEGMGDGWSGKEVARFQVVGVRAGTATVRILEIESRSDLVPGLRLHLDRRMP